MHDPRQTSHRHLHQLRAALLDLIDCGPPPAPGTLRRPTKPERAATRPDPTPTTTKTSTGTISDPTLRHTVRTEQTIAHHLARLNGIVAAYADAVTMTHHLAPTIDNTGCVPRHENGQPWPAPNVTYGAISLTQARQAVHEWCGWIGAAIDALHAVQLSPAADPMHLHGRIRETGDRLAREANRHRRRRLEPDDTRCANPHGRVNHPVGEDSRAGVCGACRKHTTRMRQTDEVAR